MSYIDKLVSLLRELDDTGTVVGPDSTKLIRKNPPRRDGLFSDSYLHEIYAGLKTDDIDKLEASIDKKLPEQLRLFYSHANGLRIFAGSLSIRGLRNNCKRGGAAWLPVSLEYGNITEKPKDDARSQIRFGWYPAQNVELVIYLDNSDEVFAVPKYKSGPVLYRWPNLEELLLTEFSRMSEIYLKQQDKIDFFNPISMPNDLQE